MTEEPLDPEQAARFLVQELEDGSAQLSSTPVQRSEVMNQILAGLSPEEAYKLFQKTQLQGCPACQGSGVERSRYARLWGGNCWICGGWGQVRVGELHLRGPFAAALSR